MPIDVWIYLIGAIVAGWITARKMWDDDDRWLAVPLAMIAWPLILAAMAIGGIFWLFIKSAEPGVIKLPKRREKEVTRHIEQRKLEKRIAELEAELEIK